MSSAKLRTLIPVVAVTLIVVLVVAVWFTVVPYYAKFADVKTVGAPANPNGYVKVLATLNFRTVSTSFSSLSSTSSGFTSSTSTVPNSPIQLQITGVALVSPGVYDVGYRIINGPGEIQFVVLRESSAGQLVSFNTPTPAQQLVNGEGSGSIEISPVGCANDGCTHYKLTVLDAGTGNVIAVSDVFVLVAANENWTDFSIQRTCDPIGGCSEIMDHGGLWSPSKTTLTFLLPSANALTVRGAVMKWYDASAAYAAQYGGELLGQLLPAVFHVEGVNSTGSEDVQFQFQAPLVLPIVGSTTRFLSADGSYVGRVLVQISVYAFFGGAEKTLVHEIGHALGLGHEYRYQLGGDWWSYEVDIMGYGTQSCISTYDLWGLQTMYTHLHLNPSIAVYGDASLPSSIPFACVLSNLY